ncbi:hypothetical protein [Pseudobdellovibrio exovorus]|uniref:Lipoprotein n=1 Tax=Pseudobdellovibrio exovorus JSS TaxID=1184267 RepID=M4V7D4_9BACT|nr:hypothetical protein [Pseudobdellovibrio exovorus]AGH95307.1 hypothetical protein A11Q_1091 [Pseudobdellovibrio exovorus JSS]
MKKLICLMALSLLAACSPQKSSVKSNINTTTATISGTPMGQCTTSVSSIGIIYDQTSYNFESQVKGLLSATLSPNEVGSISGMANAATGVRFSGLVKLDGSGNVVGSQSSFKITVYDSIWQMNQTASNLIEISFTAAKGATISGQFNTQTGDGYLSLQDQYGVVRLTGKIDAQSFSGTVSYQNSVSVVGGQPASGNLGQFYIARCALFQ